MLAEIEQFVNWVRRRNSEAHTWKDYNYDLCPFAALVGDVPPAQITFREVDRFVDMQKTRRFPLHERGQTESHITPYDPPPHTESVPAWLVEQLTRYQPVKQPNWREVRLEEGIHRFWSGHLRVWRFLVDRFGIQALREVKRVHFSAFGDWWLQSGASVKVVNGDMRTFHGYVDFLQEQGLPVPHALLGL